MSRWFRFYGEALHDPKVLRLPDHDFRMWVNLLCLASQNDGRLPSIEDIAIALRMDENAIRTVVERLVNATLIDRRSGGPNGIHYAPHGWEKRQYKSDTSTPRVKRFRERFSNVAETSPDTDTDTERKKDAADAATPHFSNPEPIAPVTGALGDPQQPTEPGDPLGLNDEAGLFRRGKVILGDNSGGLVRRLLTAKGGKIPDARLALEAAAIKGDPREYIGRIVAKAEKEKPPWERGLVKGTSGAWIKPGQSSWAI